MGAQPDSLLPGRPPLRNAHSRRFACRYEVGLRPPVLHLAELCRRLPLARQSRCNVHLPAKNADRLRQGLQERAVASRFVAPKFAIRFAIRDEAILSAEASPRD